MLTRYRAKAVSRQRAVLGESPIWDGSTLRWLDVTGKKLFILRPDGLRRSIGLSTVVTAVALGPDETLLAVTRTGLGWLDEVSGEVQEFLKVLTDDRLTMNDGAVDGQGRYWVGSATLDETARGSLYRFADGHLQTVLTSITESNGIDWSPDGRVLYHADSGAGTITAWSFDVTTGELSCPRVVRLVPSNVGLPDGLAVDSSGQIWVAIWGAGEVWCLDSVRGVRRAVISVPSPLVSSCGFGTATLDTLYITTARGAGNSDGGLLYGVRVQATGAACSRRFMGNLKGHSS